MEFELSEEHRLLQQTVRDFAAKRILPLAAELDRAHRFPAELIQEAAALGLMAMMVDEAYGGSGMDAVAYAIAQEELARASAGVQVIISVNNSLVCDPILRFGTDEQKRRYLPPLADGRALGCYCLTEPAAGSDAMSLATRAEQRGGEWILHGRKLFVTNAVEADIAIVYARTDATPGARGLSAFIVEKGFPGISVGKVERKLGIRCSSTAEIVLDDCRVPDGNLIGARGQGGKIALATLDGGRIGIAAQAVGIARACLEDSRAYALERQQFGRPIARFQAIQWALADMATRVDAARLLTHQAAWLRDHGARYTREAAQAKLVASETATWAAQRAVQVLGGYGYVEGYAAERYFRDAKITELYEGTSEVQRLVISRNMLGSESGQ